MPQSGLPPELGPVMAAYRRGLARALAELERDRANVRVVTLDDVDHGGIAMGRRSRSGPPREGLSRHGRLRRGLTFVGSPLMDASADRRRLIAVWVLPLVGLVLVIVVPLTARGRLPARLASHWDLRGVPNGSSPLPLLLAIIAAIWLGTWFVGLVQGKGIINFPGVSRDQGPAARVAAAYGAFGLLAGVVGMTVLANLDKTDWRDVHLRMTSLVAIAVIAALTAGVGFLLSRGMPTETAHT
jgi:hypothetical protein